VVSGIFCFPAKLSQLELKESPEGALYEICFSGFHEAMKSHAL
jgi:hypothetical protein